MKIFKIMLFLSMAVFIFGCAHVSKTVTHFDGKTKGFNPYGDGNIVVDRTAYWGTNSELLNILMMEK